MTNGNAPTTKERKKRQWKKNIIRIATWNTRSWNNKAPEILIQLNHKTIDICAISETKKNEQGTHQPCSRFQRTVQEKEKLLTIIDTEQDLYKISPLPTAPIITAYTHPPQKKLMKRCTRSHHLYNTPCHQRTSLSRLYKALENGLKWVETCNCGIYVHFVHKLYWVLMANYTLYLFIEHNGDVTLKRL